MKFWKIALPIFILALGLTALLLLGGKKGAITETAVTSGSEATQEFTAAVPEDLTPPFREEKAPENPVEPVGEKKEAEENNDPILGAAFFILNTFPSLAGFFAPHVQNENTNLSSYELGQEIITAAAGVTSQLGEGRLKAGRTEIVYHGKIKKGDTCSTILEKAATGSVDHFVKAAGKLHQLKSFKDGQPYKVVTDSKSGRLKRFEYEINDKNKLVVEGGKKPKARTEPVEYDTSLITASGVIGDNLFQSVADIGEGPQLAVQLVKLFGSEINFIKSIQPGDKFSVLVEKLHRDGESKGYGRILAATFTNKGKTYEAYMFYDSEGRVQYYNEKGENLKKAFLQSPLAVTRVTSRFSHARLHPILGVNRPHLGVDYGAPTGTPVKAVSDGVITMQGWAGGYGNQVVIKHSSGIESMYSHLSGFVKGLKVGSKIRQGQVIGFVGSTGLATGPHLDFRLRKDGGFLDPTKAINPRGAPVANMKEFMRVMKMEKAFLEEGRLIADYAADSILPINLKLPEDELAEMVVPPVVKMEAPRRRVRVTELSRLFRSALTREEIINIRKKLRKRR